VLQMVCTSKNACQQGGFRPFLLELALSSVQDAMPWLVPTQPLRKMEGGTAEPLSTNGFIQPGTSLSSVWVMVMVDVAGQGFIH
jgi:hypothetical protein